MTPPFNEQMRVFACCCVVAAIGLALLGWAW